MEKNGHLSGWWWKEQKYMSSDGMVVTERISSGNPPADFARFIGHAKINYAIQNGTQRIPQEHNFSFTIDVDTIVEAWAAFEELASAAAVNEEKVLKARIDAASRPKIALPG